MGAIVDNGSDVTESDENDKFSNLIRIKIKAGSSKNKTTKGDDTLTGTNGKDKIGGNKGDDTIDGPGGKDRLNGDAGDDFLFGGNGNDRLNGGGGEDTLFGQVGEDRLNGGSGDDDLIGGSGNDNLKGGGGDTFRYFSYENDGRDRIKDFSTVIDTAEINGGDAASTAVTSVGKGGDTRIVMEDGDWVTLLGLPTRVLTSPAFSSPDGASPFSRRLAGSGVPCRMQAGLWTRRQGKGTG